MHYQQKNKQQKKNEKVKLNFKDLRGAPPLENRIFRKKFEIVFSLWKGAAKFPLSEYIWLFAKSASFDRVIEGNFDSTTTFFWRNFCDFEKKCFSILGRPVN